eukprot:TRINITY_DN240_c7_g1_i1.p1 TRINITY_DN240_c7_g1~~TRINITY_DN240_c7_g1_i1.p1  ORF type:complete len:312 (+),score=67.12 TRINITY_DN240_c7_g1_i1:227-1162(+)
MPGFCRQLRCNSGIFASKQKLDWGGKIILPHSCMEELARITITYPMMFKITNPQNGRTSHCGVLEFTADEGRVVVPYWLMNHLGGDEGSTLKIEDASLPRGTFIQIRPQKKAFIELSNPKAVLERRMNDFSCLTKGDTISINYLNENYLIDILVCKVGEKDVNAISIVEADVKVDFARPLDCPPSPKHAPAPAPVASSASSASAFGGNSQSDLQKRLAEQQAGATGFNAPTQQSAPVAPPTSTNSFTAFGGAGRSLRGSAPAASSSSSSQPSSSVPAAPVRTDSYGRPLKPEAEKKDAFSAFSGKGRTLGS